jgi:hypothetical protein
MATLSSIITPSNITTATNTQTLTNKTLTGAVMNGTLGATTPSTVAATTLSASGASTFTNSAPSVIGGLGFRNRIINGDMRIDQRNEGAAVTTSGSYPVDRFITGISGTSGAFSFQRSTSVVPAGFTHSVGCTITTADASVGAGDLVGMQTTVEGNNIADFGFGSASAKTVTISFWARASVTGTYCVVIGNSSSGTGGPNRSYVSEYTISVANTWEYKTITVAGDTSGTWQTNNTRGIILRFAISAGTDFQQAAGSWSTGNVYCTSNQTQLMTTLNATWFITGVQLEVGNAATEFERRPFGQELELCFRYFRRYASDASNHCLLPGYALANATTGGYGPVQLTPIMRDNPTLSVSAAADLSVDTSGTAAALSAVSIYGGYTTKNSVFLNFTVASGLSNGQAYMFRVNSGTGKHASFSAEL